MRMLRGLLCTLALWMPAVVLADEASAVQEASRVDFEWDIKIPLRDGVRLHATLYKPKNQDRPAPCIFALTPYIAQTHHRRGIYYAARGFVFLAVDSRGRGNSEGEFRPSIQEAEDGYDVVEWAARQPYCNGKVAMAGGSYSGHAQWSTAKLLPPHLATIVPLVAVHHGTPQRRVWQLKLLFPPQGVMRWLTLVGGRTDQLNIYNDGPFWAAACREWFESGRPLKEFDTLLGNPSPIFRQWLSHPDFDAYWAAYDPTPQQYARIEIPILTMTGLYDEDGMRSHSLDFHREHLRNASPQARARHFLVIGPWNHGGDTEFGGTRFGPAGFLSPDEREQLRLEWYAWTMQGGPQPAFLEKPVAYYVTGAEQWRYADTLQEITGETRAYFLDSTGNATDVFASGSLNRGQAGKGAPDHYVYDPRDVSSAALQTQVDASSLVDQRLILAAGGKHLVYHTAPFPQDTEIGGFFRLSAWIAIDQPDTDFEVSIHEIGLDGSSLLLTKDRLRARYREGPAPKLIGTTKPLRYDFDSFMFSSRRVAKGGRLRLVIGPINSIYLEKNYNSGGVVVEESMRDARPVTVRLFHDRAHPSVLHVPISAANR